MRILWVAEQMANRGGAEYMTAVFTSLLRTRGHDVLVCALGAVHPDWCAVLSANNVPCRTVPETDQLQACAQTLVELTTEYSPDIVHFIPVEKVCKVWLEQVRKSCPQPLVGMEPTDLSSACWWLDDSDRECMRQLDGLVVVNEHALQNGVALRGSAERTWLVPNTVFPACERQAKDDCGNMTVGCISRLSSEKGVDYLLAAFSLAQKKHPELKLRLYGNGEDLMRITHLSRMLAIDSHLTTGLSYQPVTGIDRVAAECSFFVLASLFEGCPISVLELMARGKAVVATNTKGCRAVLGDDAPLAEIGDTRALADQICLFVENPGHRRRVGIANLKRFRAQFAPSMSLSRLEQAYAHCMKTTSR